MPPYCPLFLSIPGAMTLLHLDTFSIRPCWAHLSEMLVRPRAVPPVHVCPIGTGRTLPRRGLPALEVEIASTHLWTRASDRMRRRGYRLATAAEIPSMLVISASVRRRSMAAAAAAACSGREAPGMATTVSP